MVTPIIVSPEQQSIIEAVQALDARFGADQTLYHSTSAIGAAKALIDRAVAAGLDQRVYYPLQSYISMHETEQSLPEHLRSWQAKP